MILAMSERTYTKQEVDAILSRALEVQREGGTLDHADLVAAAREIGITDSAIESAAAEVLSTRDRQREVQEARAAAWRGFLRHLVPYVLVNVMLGVGNWLSGGPPWVLFIVLGWGIGLASHLLRVLLASPEQLQRGLDRREARHERRRERRRLRAGEPARETERRRVRDGEPAPAPADETADESAGQGARRL